MEVRQLRVIRTLVRGFNQRNTRSALRSGKKSRRLFRSSHSATVRPTDRAAPTAKCPRPTVTSPSNKFTLCYPSSGARVEQNASGVLGWIHVPRSFLMSYAEMCFASSVGHLSSAAAVAPRRARVAMRGFRQKVSRRTTRVVRVDAAFVSSGVTLPELKAQGGRIVVELGGGKILIQDFMEELYAVSNKCPHLGLSMQGKTALLSADMRPDGCIVCPAHGSAFDLATGAPEGEWCPGLPTLPIVGKPLVGTPAPLPTYQVRLGQNETIEVDVDAARSMKQTNGAKSADAVAEEAASEMSSDEPGSSGEDIGVLRGQELAQLKSTPFADLKPGENVVGAEGVPEAIILAERKSKPLRKYRLGSYVAASMVAAAQMIFVIQLGVEQWPEFLETAPLQILTDVMVIVSGSLLWRQELKLRAESLVVIWKKAKSREESLTRAEAGLGDTLWTSRMRKNLKMPGGLGELMGSEDEGEKE